VQDRPARRIGGALHRDHPALPADAAASCQRSQPDGRRQAGQPDVLRRGGAVGAGQADAEAGQPGQQTEGQDATDPGERRGQERHRDEQPDVLGLVEAGGDVGDDDAGGQGQAGRHPREGRAGGRRAVDGRYQVRSGTAGRLDGQVGSNQDEGQIVPRTAGGSAGDDAAGAVGPGGGAAGSGPPGR
jgi:hypothetical protein